MTADLKPCPFCGMAPSRSYGGRSGNRIWCANERCQERPLIAAETWSGAASIWNPIAPTVSDTGADRDAALAQVPAWRPIETAPRDGTIVDLWGINHLHYAKRQERICNVHYGPVTDWMGHERNDWRHGRGEDFEPTHWMPLPAPPVEKEGAE